MVTQMALSNNGIKQKTEEKKLRIFVYFVQS